MVVGDSEYIMIAQDKVGCLTANGNVDDVDLHRAPGPSCAGAYAGVGDEGVRTLRWGILQRSSKPRSCFKGALLVRGVKIRKGSRGMGARGQVQEGAMHPTGF